MQRAQARHAPRRAHNRRSARSRCHAGKITGRCRRRRRGSQQSRCRRAWWSPRWRYRHDGCGGYGGPAMHHGRTH
eukprot:scaffold92250_cov61-Phaeocystis_antarctica.AAC.5